jgi:hypothetical protein
VNGKIYFLLVRIKLKHMEVEIRRRETTGTVAVTAACCVLPTANVTAVCASTAVIMPIATVLLLSHTQNLNTSSTQHQENTTTNACSRL